MKKSLAVALSFAIVFSLVAPALSMEIESDVWSIEVVDSAGNDVGKYTSIALDSSGYPHISYYDAVAPHQNLKYAHWTGSAWSIEIVDATSGVGEYSSIALDSNDYPHISYRDGSSRDLKYASWNGTAWKKETVDSAGYVGEYTSLVLGDSDYPHISYYDATNGDLKFAMWNGSAWDVQTVDSGGNVGLCTSIAMTAPGGWPAIAYFDNTNYALKFAMYLEYGEWAISTVDSAGWVGYETSLAMDSSGFPHISYWDLTNDDLKYAWLTEYWVWNVETVDSAGDVGSFQTSLALDSADHPQISYYDGTNGNLKYANWTGSEWSITTVDVGDPEWHSVGLYSSLALDSSGFPHISYYDQSTHELKYAYMHPYVPPRPVHNLNTGLNYFTIQAAIDASETLNGHIILVDSGTYYENVVIHKSISLIGESTVDTIIDGGGAASPVVSSTPIAGLSIRGFTVRNGSTGIQLFGASNLLISENIVSDNSGGGIYGYDVHNATISANIVTDNGLNGIIFEWSSSIKADGNAITQNGLAAIYFGYSSENTAVGNTLLSNGYGVYISASSSINVTKNYIRENDWGVRIGEASNTTTVSENSIKNNFDFGVALTDSSDNIISGNNVTENGYGIYLDKSGDNWIYHNNFINNTFQTQVGSSVCAWDNGYPSGGNYWSEYIDVDLFSGPNQNEPGSDAIWDHPYIINSENIDNYPRTGKVPTQIGLIHIRADGSVDPPSAPILNVGNVHYTVTAHINGSIVIERDNIVVDGAGYTLEGNGTGNGVSLTGISNVTITSIVIRQFNTGIFLNGSSGSTLSANTMRNNDAKGIVLYHSSDNSISTNTIRNNDNGIYLYNSSGNSISTNNIIDNNDNGIYLLSSSGNSISANDIVSNYNRGIYLDSSSNNSISANTITDYNYYGIYLALSSNNSISANTITSNYYGIYLYYSSGNSISANNITYNDYGIYLDSSSNNSISVNNIRNNDEDGIVLYESSNNSITANNITNNAHDGIHLFDSPSNTISANTMTSNYYGIYLYYSSGNSISANNITYYNYYGIYLSYSSNNLIWHNNFVDNIAQAYAMTGYANTWDDGYPSGGNYWSDYNGTDANHDGIGDTPYIIYASNQDRYPFMAQNGWKNTTLTLYFWLSPNPAFVGQTVVLQGNLSDRLGQPLNNTKVDLYVNGAYAASLFTNASGWFKASAAAPSPGTYLVNVTYAGNATNNPSWLTETLSVYQTMDTKVEFSLTPNPVTVGQTVTLKGNLTTVFNNPIKNAHLELWVKIGAGSWQYMTTLYTNSTGWVQASGKVTSAGIYQVAIVYRGTSQYNPSYKIKTLTVNP